LKVTGYTGYKVTLEISKKFLLSELTFVMSVIRLPMQPITLGGSKWGIALSTKEGTNLFKNQ